jgi:hypothetical protein
MSKANWALVDKGTDKERWVAKVDGFTLEVREDSEQAEDDEECWGWRVTRPDGTTEDGDSTSEDGAKEAAESYTLPDEVAAKPVQWAHCSECHVELSESERHYSTCRTCWNKAILG